MPDDLTPGEVGRSLVRIEDSLTELRRSFDTVNATVIAMQHQVTENTKDIGVMQEERKTQKRLIFTALVAPAIILVVGFTLQMLSAANTT